MEGGERKKSKEKKREEKAGRKSRSLTTVCAEETLLSEWKAQAAQPGSG